LILAYSFFCVFFLACPLFVGLVISENADAILKEYFYIREFHMDYILLMVICLLDEKSVHLFTGL